MKKLLFFILVFITVTGLKAQNVQLHYDLGEGREYLTTTIEMFKTDKWGSNFFFFDMDYGSASNKGPSLAYLEIVRGLKFWKSPFELHLEYNGGFGQFPATPFNGAYQINDAWLFGGHYTWNNADFSKIFTLQGMYKNIRGKNDLSFQVTGVWNLNYFKNKFTMSGFADFWREDNLVGVGTDAKETDFVFLAEPQFWYNFNNHLSLGSEVEVSSNFAGHKGFLVCPTIAAKWIF